MRNIHYLKRYWSVRLLCFLSIVCSGGLPAFSQTDDAVQMIKGTVRNIEGEGIEGVSVSFVGSTKHEYSDMNGEFAIPAGSEKVILFAKTGYRSQKVEIIDENEKISVKLDNANESDRYTIGYTERERYLMTSAVSVIRSSDLERPLNTTIENAMTGKASGLTILRNSGDAPGYESSSIFIRGTGTFGAFRNPLFLVDDIERDFNRMDVLEIETIGILKDAAANVQYGQRGANGTLLVTTKRGFVGKPEIDFVAQIGLQQPTRLPDFLNSREYVSLYNKALINDGMTVPDDKRYDPATYDGSQDPYVYPDVDWYDSFLRKTAPEQQYKLSIRGGTDVIRYFVLFTYLNQGGLYKYTDLHSNFDTNLKYERYNVRSNLDASVSKSLTVSLDLAGRIENRNMPNASTADIFNTLSTVTPNAMPIQYEDGKIAGTSLYRNNPYGMISRTGYRNDRNKALQVKAQAVQKLDIITPGLSANAVVAYDGLSGYGTGKSDAYATYELQKDGTYTVYGEDKQISLAQEKFYDYYQYMLDFFGGFSYQREFDKHHVLADVRYYQSKMYTQGDNPAYARQGVNGKATYCFDRRYIAEFGFAYDGSEEFAPGNRFGFFPSISAGWVVSNESFLRDNQTVSYLKLRASYGETGNSKSGFERYAYQSHWYGFDASYGGYIFGSGYTWSDGAWEGRIPNPDLTWETSRNLNVGIDADLFKKLSLSFDLFRHDRKNIISEKKNTTSSIVGAPAPFENIGSVLNKGFDFSLIYRDTFNKVGYYVQTTVSFAKNKITAMDEVAGLPGYQQRTGKSVTQLWGLEALGFYADETDIQNSPVSTFYRTQPGDIKYKNQNPNEDNFINIYDEIPIGKPTVPEWTFGLTFGLDYAGFDFSALMSGVANRSVYLNNAAVWVLQNNNKATGIAYGAWEKGVREESATFPRLTTENNLNNFRSSSFWIKNGNFLRVNNLELGYRIPVTLLEKIKIKQIRIYVNAQNLICFDSLDKYDLDPEFPDAGVTGYPAMKSFNFGLNVKF